MFLSGLCAAVDDEDNAADGDFFSSLDAAYHLLSTHVHTVSHSANTAQANDAEPRTVPRVGVRARPVVGHVGISFTRRLISAATGAKRTAEIGLLLDHALVTDGATRYRQDERASPRRASPPASFTMSR